jgi:hypothetical protein
VLVVVAFVGGVPVSVVDVVQMVAVQDGRVAAALAVNVGVLLGWLVHGRRAFVVVVAVAEVGVLVVEVVNMPVVAHPDMSAVLAVLVVVPLGGPVAARVALVIVPVVAVMQMAVVDVIDVSDMFKRLMPAAGPVYVGVLFVA